MFSVPEIHRTENNGSYGDHYNGMQQKTPLGMA